MTAHIPEYRRHYQLHNYDGYPTEYMSIMPSNPCPSGAINYTTPDVVSDTTNSGQMEVTFTRADDTTDTHTYETTSADLAQSIRLPSCPVKNIEIRIINTPQHYYEYPTESTQQK